LNYIIIFIKIIIDKINSQNFNEAFPGIDILPELPLNENGYSQIDYNNYLINFENIHFMKKNFFPIISFV